VTENFLQKLNNDELIGGQVSNTKLSHACTPYVFGWVHVGIVSLSTLSGGGIDYIDVQMIDSQCCHMQKCDSLRLKLFFQQWNKC
jgi:hypothetical protein